MKENVPLFADHAMVFMVSGIRKKWKQPICYFFTTGAMSSSTLAAHIKHIISELHTIGLHVVATVSDQMSANVSAIKQLKEETNTICVKKGVENKYFGYLIDTEEVVHVYDVPHLLKGIRNNFLDNAVVFEWKNGKEEARWSDIVQLYELDQGEYDFRMLNKLTDAHVYAAKLKKMKVRHAAQVLSQRVSGTLRTLVRLGR